jgi:hypothetical protein
VTSEELSEVQYLYFLQSTIPYVDTLAEEGGFLSTPYFVPKCWEIYIYPT